MRKTRQVVKEVLARLDAEVEVLCPEFGRPAIPPARLIQTSPLQSLFRSGPSGNQWRG